MPSDKEMIEFERVTTELIHVHMQRRMPWNMIYDIQFHMAAAQALSEQLVASLEVYLQSKNHHHEEEKKVMEFPATWWEHFKEAWFSKWLLAKFPVQYKQVYVPVSYKVTNICPHLPVDKERQHVEWLLAPDFDRIKSRCKETI
jgi:hypothetical protein